MRTLLGIALAVTVSLTFAVPAEANWVEHKSDKFRVSMKLWSSIDVKTKEWAGGWGGMLAQKRALQIFGIAKLDTKIAKADVHKLAATVTGIPIKAWTLKAEGRKGFKEYQVGTASKDKWRYIGAWGRTAHGTYLFIVRTTEADLAKHERAYRNWLKHIKVW